MIVFDLDDTLVRYGKKKVCVPRQTFHCLRELALRGFRLCIVSYNPLCHLIAQQTGLSKFIDIIRHKKCKRSDLVSMVIPEKDMRFFYFDDRLDNINDVADVFPFVIPVHVSNPLFLYQLIQKKILAK